MEARVFERLHALVRKGYVAELGKGHPSGGIMLRHLGKAHDLLLHPDGTIEALEGRVPLHKRSVKWPAPIPAADSGDQLEFMRYVETIPRAKWLERTRPFRQKYIYVPVGMMIFLGMMLALSAIILDSF